jgi:hypothetical protein
VRPEQLVINWPETARLEFAVVKGSDLKTSRLEQTLVAFFDTEAQLRFAVGCLRSLSHIDLLACQVLSPNLNSLTDLDALRAFLTDSSVEEICRAFVEDHFVLIITVNDRSVALARDVLVEDARSSKTTLLPPTPSAW